MLTRTSELKRRTPMPRMRKARRAKGLGYQVAASTLGFYRPLGAKEISVLRSEEHRRNVASLSCVVCGRAGPSQCAHVNFGKSFARKQCDSLTFPACPDCHRAHDQGGMPRDERRRLEWHYVDTTRAELLRFNLWPRSVEAHYQTAIEPLSRMVHGEDKSDA